MRFRVVDRVWVRVRVMAWIVSYMDAQTAARFGIAELRNRGLESTVTGTFALKNFRSRERQEAQLPQRDSASATHVFLGSLTDRALH